MSAILFAPHGDDESLFAAYTCMRERLHVIVCSQDANPDVRRKRSIETTNAISILGCSHQEWPMSAADINWNQARELAQAWAKMDPPRVYAPAVHPQGHEQHNRVGELALEVYGDKVIPYCTYAPRGQRQIGEIEVIPSADEISRKLRAIACYRTQIENPPTRPWFFDLLDLREWHD
jgi:LmbE family N-acetylglucosaminyl deacetylase